MASDLSAAFDDLSTRFVVDCPEADLSSNERLCFVLESAHWYYEDFLRETNPSLPGFKFDEFCRRFFAHCPTLRARQHMVAEIVGDFVAYKTAIPVCGTIILNEAVDKVLLVSSYSKRTSWGFPRGKIAKDEDQRTCAIRETIEEVGFDVSPYLRDDLYIDHYVMGHMVRLYICAGVPESTQFVTYTRKEIAEIRWHPLSQLPHKTDKQDKQDRKKSMQYYLCFPFLRQLFEWVSKRKVQNGSSSTPASSRKKKKTAAQRDAETFGSVTVLPSQVPTASKATVHTAVLDASSLEESFLSSVSAPSPARSSTTSNDSEGSAQSPNTAGSSSSQNNSSFEFFAFDRESLLKCVEV
jgi:mRNA-decapping enzyme subunit 2